MTPVPEIFVDDGQCTVCGKPIGCIPFDSELRAAIQAATTREIEKRGEVDEIPFERRVGLYDDLGISFCYNISDSKVIWLKAQFDQADWRRTTENDLASNFEGKIRIGRFTANRSIRSSTFEDTVDTSLRDLSIHAAPCESGMLSCVTIGFPKNEGEQSSAPDASHGLS